MTVTAGTSAPATSAGDRTRAQIGQLGNLLQQRRTLLFQSGNSIGHWASLTERIIYARELVAKKETNDWPHLCRTPSPKNILDAMADLSSDGNDGAKVVLRDATN